MRRSGSTHTRFLVPEADLRSGPGTARIGLARHLPEVLRELGVDVRDALEAAAVREDIFDDPENRIAYPQYARLLLTCERLSGCEHVGLLVGQRARLADFGLAGQVTLCGASVGEGLQRFVGNFNLQSSASTVSVDSSGGYTRFVYAITEPTMGDSRQLQLGAVAIVFNILQELCGNGWRPTVVTIASRGPSELRPCQRFFRAPLRFDSDESALVFEEHWLDRPLPTVDPLLRRRVETEARARQASIRADFAGSVRRLLRQRLQLGGFSMDQLAGLLGMHRRTLDRHLKRSGVAYGELLESVKREVAQQLLLDTELQVQSIAESLGYSSAANFATAFRRWTGRTPREYRRRAAG